MKFTLPNILSEIQRKEAKVATETAHTIEEAYQMTTYLQDLLHAIKFSVVKDGFEINSQFSTYYDYQIARTMFPT